MRHTNDFSNQNLLLSEEIQISNERCQFSFKSEQQAIHSLQAVKKIIEDGKHLIEEAVKKNEELSTYYFHLNFDELTILRNHLRKIATIELPKTAFAFKTIRADKDNYYRRFVEMVNEPNKRYPLRHGKKKKITVTGKAIYQRKKLANISLPTKIAQYTEKEKKGFSNFQSATLGLPSYYSAVFGFLNRAESLIGVMFNEEDVLYSDRLYIDDGGTVGRPYEFKESEFEKAEKYFLRKAGKTLFSFDQLKEFKSAIQQNSNQDKYNEILARLRWNIKTSKIFIGSDNLESRILAQEYARIMKDYLLKNNLCDEEYSVPICFYVPSDPTINFKSYTPAEQQIDRVQAQFIYADAIKRQKKFSEQNYEILLALPPDELKKAIRENDVGLSIILSILLNGYVHIFHSIKEKIGNEKLIFDLLEEEINKPQNASLLSTLLYHSLRCQDQNLAKFIFEKSKFDQLPAISVDIDNNPLLMAAEKNLPEWIEKLLTTKKFNIDMANTSKKTAAHLAADYGNFESLKILIEHKANLFLPDFHGKTPYEYTLSHEIEIDEAYKHLGFTSFHIAIHERNINKLEKALKENAHEINTPDQTGNTPIKFSVQMNDLSAFKLLYAAKAGYIPGLTILNTTFSINWNEIDKNGQTPSYLAIKNALILTEDSLFDTDADANEENSIVVDISALAVLAENGADLYPAAFIAAKQREEELLKILSTLGINISIAQHIGLSDDFNQLHSLVTRIKCLPNEINLKLNARLLTLKEQADQCFQAGTQSFKSVNSQEDWQIAVHHLQEAYIKIKRELDDFNSIKIKIDTQLINEDEIPAENIKEKINIILLNKVEWNNATLADLLNKKQNAALILKEISEMANQLLDISKKYPTVSSVTMAQENQEALSFYTILRDLPNKKALNRLEEIYNVITSPEAPVYSHL